ncbi:nuclear transport factor 2 family protein [Mesorhizobium sp.]|uniref:nuclear transport factor 2 family protein n=1 Tax=Mesorhizobium sp. TaxID=1871066 RepID=UPI0025E1EE3E|nr:nuclear transport factor 2 family protein [Mesorhizobium sp.]
MTLHLPDPIAAYFAADKRDGQAVARCFTKDATVKDERRTYAGLQEIRRWRTEVSDKYTYTSEPFAIQEADGLTIVKSHLAGNFPGSPVDLRYFFRLERGKISFLEIIP